MSAHCDNPDKCPAISTITGELKLVHVNYSISQQAILESTKELSKVNIALVENTNEVKHLCSDLGELKNDNKDQHNVLFSRNRDRETEAKALKDELAVISISQATKLSPGDLLKIILGMTTLFGFFLAFLKYLKL